MIHPHPTASTHDIHPAPPTWHNGLCHNSKAFQIHHNCLDRVESLAIRERGGSSTMTTDNWWVWYRVAKDDWWKVM